MQKYSLVISIYGWSAVHALTGRKLEGEYEDLPGEISKALFSVIKPGSRALCVACRVNLPETSLFHQWFLRQAPII